MTLSVVVTIVEGGASLDGCLAALESQQPPGGLDIIVPYDDTVTGVAGHAARFPRARFLPMGHVPTAARARSPRGQHELFDRRRAHGLAAAHGELVAILEDRGAPTSGWARAVVRLHNELPHAVIGGAVENADGRLVNRAVYYCDFSRYQRPFPAGPARHVTDVNVSYKRRALDDTRALWDERYHETIVHEALLARGETLYLTPELVVEQRRTVTAWPALLRERVDWGRLFAYTRVKNAGGGKRLAWLGASPLIPVVMLLRQARLQAGKGHLGSYLPAAPGAALLLLAWGVGEAIGYLTGKP